MYSGANTKSFFSIRYRNTVLYRYLVVRQQYSVHVPAQRNISTLLNDEDYKLSLPSFQGKIANLDPSSQIVFTNEYFRRFQITQAAAFEKKLAAEKEAQAAAFEKKLAVEKEAQAAELEKLSAEKEAQAAELEKVIADKNAEIKKFSSIKMLGGTSMEVFKRISLFEIVPEVYRTCPMDKILESWRKCKNSPLMPDLARMDRESKKSIHEDAVQKAFPEGLKIILSTLRYRHEVVQKEKNHPLEGQPDVVLAKQGAKSPGVTDVLALVELKAPSVKMHKAASQVGGYLYANAGSRLEHKQSLQSLVAVGSNYNEICVLAYLKPDQIYLYRRAQSPCFPEGWKTMEDPTDGFIDLCHAIYQTGDSTATYITINDVNVPITGKIYEGEGIGVYRCTYPNEDIVIKQGFGKRGKGLVELELEKFKIVSKLNEFRPYLVPLKQDLHIQYGFAMPSAIAITNPNLHTHGFLEEQYKWLIQGLKILHAKKLYHVDIRPGNIVIYKKTARFIDWFTLQIGDSIINAWMRQGQDDPFWPVHLEKFNETSLFDLWDLISLGYTFLFLAADHSVRLQLYECRWDAVGHLSTDMTLVGKMARIVQYLETASVDDSNRDELYATCLSIVTTSPSAK